jgi:transposase
VNRIICGVDVSKDWLDAHVAPAGKAGRFGNDAAGISELAAFCGQHEVELVVMEASGGYERPAFLLLSELGQPCAAPVNARNVRRFAEAMGFLEKTDKIDAAMIAHFAVVRKLRPTPPPSAGQQRLAALVSRLAQVTGDSSSTSSAGLRHATPRRLPASRRSSPCSSARSAGCRARSPP